MNRSPSGRLELTWTNKHLRLLAEEDGSYEWVNPSDHRIAEVRLLRDAGSVGEKGLRGSGNLLIRGDALHALLSLTHLSEFETSYARKVRLIYIDPPFNTQESFLQYDDALEHSVWLTMMRDRLQQARHLLAEDGSVWVHCDDSEMAYLKVLMDEVFGRQAWVSSIIWQKRTSRENRAAFSSMHDYLLVYAPMGAPAWRGRRNRLFDLRNASNRDRDPRGPWTSAPMSAQGYRPNQMYEITTPSGMLHKPPKGRCWSMVRESFEELLNDNRIYWPRNGAGRPRVKKFASEADGLVPFTIWTAAEVGENSDAKKHLMQMFPKQRAFATPKPESLMMRIVHIGSDPGDIILDFFGGSGTTAAVAQKMGRRWVTVERSEDTIATYALPRLQKVIRGEELGGVTGLVGWQGGGGFGVLDVAPSMFKEVDGVVLLAEWAVGGDLGEATAAQLGFVYEEDSAPFCGRKGRCRLAVVDGRVNEQVIGILAEVLGEDESMIVCGTSVDPEARTALPSGSDLQKIPNSILEQYRRTYRSRRYRELGIESAKDEPGPAAANA